MTNNLIYESKFLKFSKNRLIHTYYQAFFPIYDFIEGKKNIKPFFNYNSILYAYAYFLDTSLDDINLNCSTRIRASQISQFLLLKYFEWLENIKDGGLISKFYMFFNRYSNYLIQEKKWDYPEDYIKLYFRRAGISNKGLLLKFPFEISEFDSPVKYLFTNYHSFLFLADDITDFYEDVSNKTITYPIALFFEKNGYLPERRSNINSIIPELQIELSFFLNQITCFEKQTGIESKIINNTILNTKDKLIQLGVKIE